jgi:hypothetical protein
VALALALAASTAPAAGQSVYQGSGATTNTAVSDFRTALGGGTTAGANGSFSDITGDRREINWDGVPDALAAPNGLPANFFNSNSPRGVVFSTPGTGFEVSADSSNPTSTPIEFGDINGSYSQLFTTFSPERLFTAINSNIVDVTFFIPGTNIPAFTSGFGAVFTDVDLAGSTTLSFFGAGNVFLGTWNVPNITGNETLSFLGVLFSDPVISRVRITSGNSALGPNETAETDLVVMDDFIFGEPTLRNAVPEPSTWAMLLIGFAATGWQMRRRRSGGRAAPKVGPFSSSAAAVAAAPAESVAGRSSVAAGTVYGS